MTTTEEEAPLAGPGGLFAKIRAYVPTPQGQGQVFERLVKAFLTHDPLFAERFSRVWLWSAWPGNRGERDTGIDLVAEERDGGTCAIQCKFYGAGQHLGREQLDSFLVASARTTLTSRILVPTRTPTWSANVTARDGTPTPPPRSPSRPSGAARPGARAGRDGG